MADARTSTKCWESAGTESGDANALQQWPSARPSTERPFPRPSSAQ
jgi:hypothetical protein